MGYFPLRAFPGVAWPPIIESGLAQVWSAYQALDRTQWLEPAEVERGQLAQARTLLAHAAAHVPYYRRLFAQSGIVPAAIQSLADFQRIPLLTRRLSQDHFEERCTDRLPPGTQPGSIMNTSGSTGMPVKVPSTNMCNLWWHAFYLRDVEWCGLRPKGTLAIIRNSSATGDKQQALMQGVQLPTWLRELHSLIEFGPCHGMDIRQDHRRQVHWLRALRPDYLLTYPTNAGALAAVIEQEGQAVPGLRAVHLISESVPPELQARVEAAFAAPVKNTYSCTEAGYLASPCPDGHGFHVHAENVLFEVLDEYDRPCAPGATGRVAVTTLHNFRAPFIRYDIGDEVTLSPGRCPCKRGLPLLTRIHGKVRILFRLPDGRLKRSGILAESLSKIGHHRRHQVVQKSLEHVLVRIVPNASWTADHHERVKQLFDDFFERAVRVEIQLVEEIEAPASGKFQSMVCDV